jgi:phosphoglycolate phosphatase
LEVMRLSGHRLFVVTNKPRDITIKILQTHGVMKHFEAVVTRDSRNPEFSTKGDILESLVSSYALEKSHCLFVGDTRDDADAACKCSVAFAFAAYGYGTIDSSAVPVRHIVDGFSQVPQLLSPEFAHDR